MRAYAHKTSPKVVGGKVQRKNNWSVTPTYWNRRQPVPVIDREEPGYGRRHVLRRRDLLAFIDLLPDWEELSRGLDAIVLARGDEGTDGWHNNGIIGICAWERDLWRATTRKNFEDHSELFERLEVPCERRGDSWLLKFTGAKVKAYQLLHVLPHELGHHRDRVTTRSRRRACRGEGFAERYAFECEDRIWDRYMQVFGFPD
jgi:hypothetical protein